MFTLFTFYLIKEYYFIFSILILFIFCFYFGIFNKLNNKLIVLNKQLILSSILFLFYYLFILYTNVLGMQYIFFNLLISNNFILIVQCILIIIVILFLLLSDNSVKMNNSFEFYLVILISIFGCLLLVSFVDIIGIYLSIELISICIYFLITINKYNIYSNEAALKYFILSSISSNFVLFGFSYIYMSTGLTNIEDLYKLIFQYFINFTEIIYYFENYIINLNLIFAFFFIFIGLFFKIYVAPFHFWVPDIYHNAPIIVTTFLNTIPLLPFIIIVLRCSFYLNIMNSIWSYFFLYFAICSILFGTFGALFQSKIRKLFAYSGITHVGYFLLFIYLFISYDVICTYSIQLLFTYLIIYLFTNIGIFSVFLNLYQYKRFQFKYIDEFFKLSFLYKSNGLLSFIFIIFFFSFIGLPPLPGFVGKLFLFSLILSTYDQIILFIIVLIIAVISCFYYLRIIKVIYYNSFMSWVYFPTLNYSNSVIITLIFLFLLNFFFFSEYISIFSLYFVLTFI